MILFDTNVWSVLPKPAGQEQVATWISERMDDAWLSVIAISEIRMGIENPQATQHRDLHARWLADLLTLCENRILDFDTASAQIFGTLVARRKMQKQETKLLDLQLAAQALVRDCPIATRNVKDFDWTGVKLINPWDA